MQPTFLPLPPEDLTAPFRVDGTMAVRGVVRELLSSTTLITLYAGEDLDRFVITRLLSLEANSIEFDWSGSADALQALRTAPYLTAIGTSGTVKIQLRLQDFRVVEEPRGARLSAPIPAQAWRVQRRGAFRVHPPEHDQAIVVVRRAGGGETASPLVDLSVGGLSLRQPPAGAKPLELGSTLRHCRIEAIHIAPIPCDLRIVRIRHDDAGAEAIVSCEFYAMPQEVSRLVQIYVMDVERRARR
ncbi:MAG: flagellar brake protein [Lautropia sp.]